MIETLLVTVGVPGTSALGVTLAGRRWGRVADPWLALAMLAAVVAGSWGIVGRPVLAPPDISQWMPHIAVLAFVGAIASWRLRERRWVWLVPAILALAITYVVARPILDARWGTAGPIAVIVLGATQFGYGVAMKRVVERTVPRLGATVLVIALVTAAASAGASGSLTVGQLGGAAASGAGALWLVTLLRPASIAAMTPVAAAIGWAVVVIGVFYASMPRAVAGLVLAVPVVAIVVHQVTHRRLARASGIVVLIATLATAGVAVQRALSPSSTIAEVEYGYE